MNMPLSVSEPVAAPRVRRPVAFHAGPTARRLGHDLLTKMAIAEQLAALLQVDFLGHLSEFELAAVPTLVVPGDTVVGLAHARRLGIVDAGTVFGGVVPHAFAATKLISHPLVADDARAPAGWSPRFGREAAGLVLPGFSAFSVADALQAGRRLLEQGAVRVKDPDGVGGSGQHVVCSEAELQACIDAMSPQDVASGGVVLERNLNDVVTLSVGQVQAGEWLATYCGTQTLTRNHRGDEVYGGSRLTVVRGDYAELLRLRLNAAQRLAVEQALGYHRAAMACFDGLIATRANYDVAQGVDDAGAVRSGVLEQSWRIGGASGAELLALQAFAAQPGLHTVCVSTHEVYADAVDVPAGARVNFSGTDEHVGALTKYALLEPHDDA